MGSFKEDQSSLGISETRLTLDQGKMGTKNDLNERILLKPGFLYQFCTKEHNQLRTLNEFLTETIVRYNGKDFVFPNRNRKLSYKDIESKYNVQKISQYQPNQDIYNALVAEFPIEFELQFNEIVQQLTSNVFIGQNGFREMLGILKKYDGNAVIKYLFIATCYYFLGHFGQVKRCINYLLSKYPQLKENELIKKFENVFEFSNRTLKRRIFKALYILSYDLSSERDDAVKDFAILNKFKWDKNVAFLTQFTNEFNRVDDMQYFIKGNRPAHLILAGHGDTESGFLVQLGQNYEYNSGISQIEMKKIISCLADDKESALILIGCNPDIYKGIKIERKNKTYLICSETVNVSSFKMFLYGFYFIFNRTYNFESAYHGGRLSAAIRGFDKTDYLLFKLNL